MTVWERIKQLSEKLGSSSAGRVASKVFQTTPPGQAIVQAKKGLQAVGRWEAPVRDAIRQTAPGTVQRFGNKLTGQGTFFQRTPVLRNVQNMASNVGQVVASGATDIVSNAYKGLSDRPNRGVSAFGTPIKPKYVLGATRGVSKIAAAGTPFFQGANIVSNLPARIGEVDLFRRFAGGITEGMSQTPGLRSSADNKTMKIFGQDIDPIKAVGSMVGYVKNPQNKEILDVTGKIFPTVKNAGVIKWLGSTFVRGIFEDLALEYPDMPDNLSTKEKAKWVLQTGLRGGVMEVGGQTIMQGGGEIVQKAVKQFIGDEKALAYMFDFVRSKITGKGRSRLLRTSFNKSGEKVTEGSLGLIRKVIGKDGIERYQNKSGSSKGGQWASLDSDRVGEIERLARDPFVNLADLSAKTRGQVNEYRFINKLEDQLRAARVSKMRFKQDPDNPRRFTRMPPEEMMGAMAGVEPYQDEEGNWKVKYNAERGVLGMGLMAGRQALDNSAIKNADGELKAKVEPQAKIREILPFEKEMDELKGQTKQQLERRGPKQEEPFVRATLTDQRASGKLQEKAIPKTPLQRLNQDQQKVKGSESFESIISREGVTVKEKINLLDYIRTPDRVLTKMGLGEESKYLRKQYNSYLQELPKEIDRITQWQKRVPDSSQKLFQYLDGQDVKLNKEELKVAGEIKSYLKVWADRLELPEDNRIANYITRIFEKDFIQKEFDPELALLIRDKVPGSVYDPFLQKRLGKLGYVEDVWRALDAYVKRGTRKVNLDPALAKIKDASNGLEDSQFNYVKSYIDRVNMRPTQLDNLADNTIKQVVGYKFGQRPTAYLTRKARQAVYRGTLGLNPATALKNLSQGANTYAVLGEKYTLKGYIDLITNGVDELKKVGVLDDGIIQDRTLSANKKFIQGVDKVLFSIFDFTEKINRGSAYYGAKAKAISQGKSEKQAIEYGLKIVRDTQFTFGSVDTPVALQSDIAKIFSQFQTFTLKQGEFLSEQVAKKNYAGLLRYAGATVVFIATIGKSLGMDFKDIIPSFRFDIPPTLKAPIEGVKALLGTKDEYGQERDTEQKLKDVGKSLIPFIPGGTQIRKSVQGAKLIDRGYSATPAGKARFLAPQSTFGKIKAVLFGQYNTPEGREWVNKGFPYLSDKQTLELEKRLDNPESAKFYFDSVMQAKDVETPSTDESADFNKLQKKYPKTYLYHSAEKMYSDINKLKKTDVEGKRALLNEYKARGFDGDELKNTLLKIIELDKEGMARSDREMLLYQGQARAYKIIERFDGLEDKKRKKELLNLYRKYGIINEEIEQYIIKLKG